VADRRPLPAGSPAVETLIAVRRARDLIDRSYAEPLDLDAIAAAAGYSRYYFVRAFRAAYGETPGQYLSRRRVERAQELLRSVNLTVTEVCHLVGFSSLGSFSGRFRELVGVSPSQFQRAAARTGPPPIPGCFVLMSAGRPGMPAARPGKRATTEKPAAGPSD
jgi:AraC-like DNA-binding protein